MHRLLVADDERAALDGLVRFVDWRSVGFEVVGAFEDGTDAIEFLKRESVDVVLTDIRMAKRSGLDIAEFLYEAKRRERVVVLSAFAEFDYAQRALRYQIVDYLLKPVDLLALRVLFQNLAADLDRENLERSVAAIGAGEREVFFHELSRCSRAELRDIQRIVDEICTTRAEGDSGTNNYPNLIIERALQYLEEHYAEDVSLEMIADYVHLSPPYFSRIFKRKTGTTFKQGITRMRLRRARNLLLETNMKIKDIGNEVGFPNEKYFAWVFRRSFGTSPLAYRHLSVPIAP